MGALLTVGTLLLIPIFGRRDLSWRSRITEPACTKGRPYAPAARAPVQRRSPYRSPPASTA